MLRRLSARFELFVKIVQDEHEEFGAVLLLSEPEPLGSAVLDEIGRSYERSLGQMHRRKENFELKEKRTLCDRLVLTLKNGGDESKH